MCGYYAYRVVFNMTVIFANRLSPSSIWLDTSATWKPRSLEWQDMLQISQCLWYAYSYQPLTCTINLVWEFVFLQILFVIWILSDFFQVGANAGIVGMTKEHLGLALALSVPVFVVVTKVIISGPCAVSWHWNYPYFVPNQVMIKYTIKEIVLFPDWYVSGECTSRYDEATRKDPQISWLSEDSSGCPYCRWCRCVCYKLCLRKALSNFQGTSRTKML